MKDFKVIAAGRAMHRDERYEKGVSIHIRTDLQEVIDQRMSGNRQLLVNFLIERGIMSLVDDSESMFIVEDDGDHVIKIDSENSENAKFIKFEKQA